SDAIGTQPPTGFTQVLGTNLSGGPASGNENWQVGTVASSASPDMSFAGNPTQFAYFNDDREPAQDGGEDFAIRAAPTDTSAFTSLALNFDYLVTRQFGAGVGEVWAR